MKLQGDKIPELVTMWQKATSDYVHQWSQLSSAIKGSAIDPLLIDCTLPPEDMVSTAVTLMEGTYIMFSLHLMTTFAQIKAVPGPPYSLVNNLKHE